MIGRPADIRLHLDRGSAGRGGQLVGEVTVIGGGAGSFNLLSGLRAQTDFALRSIVTMMDSGGDSGALRDAFGVLPPGDLRRCLVALSEESQILRDLFSFRFGEGPLAGRNFGNLFFLALTRSLGSEQQAVSALSRILKIRGEVIPVTWDHAQLVARVKDGSFLRGEAAIDNRGRREGPHPSPIDAIWLEPAARANPAALDAIRGCDALVLAPGDVFTSLVPNLLVAGVADAIRESRGTLVFVVNLMTKAGETDDWSAFRHIGELAQRAGRTPDAVLVHAGEFARARLVDYAREGAVPVVDDLGAEASAPYRIVRADLASEGALIHHDPDRTARALVELLGGAAARVLRTA
jgi:uncharacterized cofD-like protein